MSRQIHDARAVLKDVPAIVIRDDARTPPPGRTRADPSTVRDEFLGARLRGQLPNDIGHLAGAAYQRAIDIDTNQSNQRFLPSASTGHAIVA